MSKLIRATALGLSLLAIPAAVNAADLGVPPAAPAPVRVPWVFSWTGFYAGGNIGGLWRNGTATDSLNNVSFGTQSDFTFMGGGQAGYNYQFSNVVIGVEGEFDATTNTTHSTPGVTLGPATVIQLSSSERWVATLAGRLGYAAANWLFYAKGGGAWVNNSGFTVSNIANGVPLVSATSGGGTQSGWLVGGGIEWAFWNNWSAKLEYDFIGLDNTSFTIPAGPLPAGDTFTLHGQNVQMVKIGINYLFNGAPPY